MLMITLAISCLTMSNLPWFMNLTFQVPMQCYPLKHPILLTSPNPSTTECCLRFGPAASLFLELLVVVLCSSPEAYWTPSSLSGSSFSVTSFCLFIQFMEFSRLVYWSVCHSLLQWITFCQNPPLWLICLGWPFTAWLIASLSYASLFAMTRQWSMKGSYCTYTPKPEEHKETSEGY